jgi:dihydrofolate synthase/folylpolyglutamate synthase
MTYPEAVAWLYGTQLHGIKLGLESIEQLTEAVVAPPFPRFIHVAGTNGKGSVCAMADAVYRAAGFRTGLYTSPHLVTFRERIRLNGEMIPEEDVAEGLSEIRALMNDWEHAPTFFEIVTALALAWFQRRGAEIAILETGMGGRLDATNVVTPAVSVLTPIGLDHQAWLGSTVAEIAAEKAGILKPGVPAVSAPQTPEAAAVLRETAARVGTSLRFVEQPLDADWRISLAGRHQRWNAALVVEALAVSGVSVPVKALRTGLATVQWPGRFQRIGERVVLDGAHNPHAAIRLAETWREEFGDGKATLIFGAMRDKDVAGVLAALSPIAARVLVVAVQNARACTPEDLCEISRGVNAALPCAASDSLSAALVSAEAHPERILIAGSLFLIGEALAHFDPASIQTERSEQ